MAFSSSHIDSVITQPQTETAPANDEVCCSALQDEVFISGFAESGKVW
jgi:hypothetical protein